MRTLRSRAFSQAIAAGALALAAALGASADDDALRGHALVQAVDAAGGVVTLGGTAYAVDRSTQLLGLEGQKIALATLRTLEGAGSPLVREDEVDAVYYEAHAAASGPVLDLLQRIPRMPR